MTRKRYPEEQLTFALRPRDRAIANLLCVRLAPRQSARRVDQAPGSRLRDRLPCPPLVNRRPFV